MQAGAGGAAAVESNGNQDLGGLESSHSAIFGGSGNSAGIGRFGGSGGGSFGGSGGGLGGGDFGGGFGNAPMENGNTSAPAVVGCCSAQLIGHLTCHLVTLVAAAASSKH